MLLDGEADGVARAVRALDGHLDRALAVRDFHHQALAVDFERDLLVAEEDLLRGGQVVPLDDHRLAGDARFGRTLSIRMGLLIDGLLADCDARDAVTAVDLALPGASRVNPLRLDGGQGEASNPGTCLAGATWSRFRLHPLVHHDRSGPPVGEDERHRGARRA